VRENILDLLPPVLRGRKLKEPAVLFDELVQRGQMEPTLGWMELFQHHKCRSKPFFPVCVKGGKKWEEKKKISPEGNTKKKESNQKNWKSERKENNKRESGRKSLRVGNKKEAKRQKEDKKKGKNSPSGEGNQFVLTNRAVTVQWDQRWRRRIADEFGRRGTLRDLVR
jgi:hypothetical protein